MSELVYRANLKLWLKGDGFHIGPAWNDSSGFANGLNGGTAPAIAYPTTGVPPYVDFDGTTHFLTGPTAQSVYMVGAGSTLFFAIWADTAAGTGATAQADNAIIGAANTQSPIVSVATLAGVPSLIADITDSGGRKTVSTAVGFALGQWVVGWFGWDGSKLYLGTDPIIFASIAAGNAIVLTATTQVAKGVTAPKFFDGRIGEILCYRAALAEGDRASVFNYLRARWTSTGDTLEMMRDRASREAWTLGKSRLHMSMLGIPPETVLPATLLDPAQETFISHPRGIEASGAGWGELSDWEPRPGRPEEATFDFDAPAVTLKTADLFAFRHALIDSGIGVAAGPRREGQMVGSAGATRAYSSDFGAQYITPVDGASVVSALPDEERLTAYGLSLHETQNYLLRSAFVSGTTGLTLAGTGVGGSAIALDVTKTIFGTDVQPTPQSLKFTAGSPHSADLKATWPASNAFVNSSTLAGPIWLAIIHEGNGAPAVQVQRSTDSKWLQDAAGNWGAAAVWVTIPASGSPFPSLVSILPLGTVGGAGTSTYTYTFGLPSGGTAGRIHNVYYCALTDWGAPAANGLLAVSDAAVVSESTESMFQVFINSLGVGGPIDSQTIAMIVRPCFTGSLHGTTQGNTLAWFSTTPILGIGAATGWELRFDGTGNLAWRAAAAGPTYYTSQVPFSPTMGVPMRIVVRRISSHGDLGLTPYTLSIFVNGVKGVDAIESTHPTDANVSYLPASGCAVSMQVYSPRAWPDAECVAWGL